MIVLFQLIKHVVAICRADATVRVEILQFEGHLFLFDYWFVQEFVDCFAVVVEFELICRKLELLYDLLDHLGSVPTAKILANLVFCYFFEFLGFRVPLVFDFLSFPSFIQNFSEKHFFKLRFLFRQKLLYLHMQCGLVLASTVRFLPLALITMFIVFYLTHTPIFRVLFLLLLERLLHRCTPIQTELFVLRQKALRCFLRRLAPLLRVYVVPLFFLNHSVVEFV
jgi:hypothetical protein